MPEQFQSSIIRNRHKKTFPKTWVPSNNRFKDSERKKKTKNPVLAWKINKRNARPSAKIEHGACSQEEINWSKIEKGFRIKLLELFKTRTNKSILDLFNFYVVSVGHDMVTDVGRATRLRRKFKVQSVQKIKDLPKTRVLTGKQFENFRQKN